MFLPSQALSILAHVRGAGSQCERRDEGRGLMYQLSRAIYRELSPSITGGPDAQEQVLHACEATVERLVGDRHYFARPARYLFQEIKPHFPMHPPPTAGGRGGGGGGGA